MMDDIHLIKSQILNLAPFFNFVILYFAFVRDPQGELWTTVLKCAPIVCLMFYILLKGFSLTKDFRCSQRILVGLAFSCAGDALLNIDLFPYGMGAFALAHIFYISAFGWKPLKLPIGVVLYVVHVAIMAVIFKKLEDILVFGVPIYGALLLTMCWRSLAQALSKPTFLNIFCAVGCVLFVISDGLIAVSMFLTDVPHDRIWIMVTYYLAQLAIALSTAHEIKRTTKTGSPKNNKHRSGNMRSKTK